MENKCENCGKCCVLTEMLLSQQDIDLIIQNFPKEINKEDFVFKNQDGFFQLKNLEKYCIFFDSFSNKCTIYEYRPQGCNFYPLIYDFTQNKCIFDKDCPRTNLFYKYKQDLKIACQNLKIFLKKQLNMKIL